VLEGALPILPSPMIVFFPILATYFLVVSGFIYDIIIEPLGIKRVEDLDHEDHETHGISL
jgi:hypothetical protein